MSLEPVCFEIRCLIGLRICIEVCEEAEAGTDYEDGEGEVWMWIWMCLGFEGRLLFALVLMLRWWDVRWIGRGNGVCCNFRIERTKLGSSLRKRQSNLD